MILRLTAAALLAAGLATAPALAQDSHSGHSAHGSEMPAGTAAEAYAAANAAMHEAMAIEFSGDADVDFVRGMIAHHEGAIAMAKILKAHGKDPWLLTLADEIIIAQEKEVADMQAWLKEKGLE